MFSSSSRIHTEVATSYFVWLSTSAKCKNFTDAPYHRRLDVTSNLLGSVEHEAVRSDDVAASHADACVAEKRLYRQFAETQLVSRAGVGMTEAMRGVVGANNPPPRVGEY